MTQSLVVGVDAGATSTRIAVHRLDGVRVGYARAGAGNPTAHGLDKAVAAIATALKAALPAGNAPRVAASLAGVAGLSPEIVTALADVWAAHGLPAAPQCVGDDITAYAAGSAAPDGTLLMSGTGAGAARVAGYERVAVADALGWLLGDAGSGFWIGRAAAKHVIEALDRGMPVPPADPGGKAEEGEGVLAGLVVRHFLGDERPATPRLAADRIVRLAQAEHMRLAALSPLVSRAAMDGDPVAVKIVQEAAGCLVTTLRRVHRTGPVVLAGSVLTTDGPVRRAVGELLAGETVVTSGDAAGAAAWLAARPLLPAADATARHAAFTDPA
ncbi:N-acetylglucosamine kinase [Nonomuraea candida]|uniref:N-acetylglucosamine kinase n=1 Tax=Nonomuraea candida TaxID=359159 RepID=UPI0005BCC9AE|nr:BadF/BadG/BcrA/BcrD ATPase family protein [Nonomuraea candida]